jgi:hypothetical protein
MADGQVAHCGLRVAEMNYLDDPPQIEDGNGLHYLADFSGTTNVRLAPRQVQIQDARANPAELTLDRQGITLTRAPSRIHSFQDADDRGADYADECAALIRDLTGAAATFGMPPHCRFDGAKDSKRRFDGAPTRFVHADYSDGSALEFAGFFPVGVARYPRFAIYNIWRVLTPPPQSTPLAVCDAQSLSPEDEMESVVVMNYPDKDHIVTRTTLYRPNARHRWYFFSDMMPDEALIFKGHDSDPAHPKRSPHSAFIDAQCKAGSERISSETRVLAVFDR